MFIPIPGRMEFHTAAKVAHNIYKASKSIARNLLSKCTIPDAPSGATTSVAVPVCLLF